MQHSFEFFMKRHAVLIFIFTFLFLISAQCQPPVTIPTEQSPNQQTINDVLQQNGINPTQLTQQNFKKYFEDNNQKNAGTDINKENTELVNKMSNKSLDKDSLQKD